MPEFVVDISSVQAPIQEFPNGPVEAQVAKAELDVAKSSGNMMLRIEFEIYHPDHGTATLRDFLPVTFPAKVKAFWQALNDLTAEQMAEQPEVNIDPDEIVGSQLIIQLGEQEGNNGKLYKNVSSPWYYPLSRATDLLDYIETPI